MQIGIINLADIINTIIQSLMMILISNYCTEYRNKNSKLKLLFLVVALSCITTGTTYLVGNSSLGTIFIHVVLIFIGIIVFRKDSLGATVSISIVYLAIIINGFIMSNLYLLFFQYIIPEKYFMFGYIGLMYVPQVIMGAFILFKKELIYKIYLIIRSKKLSIMSLIITTVVADFIISFNFIMHDLDNPMFKNAIFMLMGLFIIGITIYYSNIENKSKEIILLNKELEEKINELKKVKHDYRAQMSYLYGLYLMGKYDRLGGALKDIINGNNCVSSEVNIINKTDSIIADFFYGIDHNGINIIINDEIDFNDINISELDYQRIISNILRNAVTAMEGKGIIEIKSYYTIEYAVIKIKNNGPKIEENIIDKIFQVGVSTKVNENKDNGFGLPIVKDIVEKNGGTVEVDSNELFTEFTIKIPKR
ncbi:ATP-binding protein [Clostridioides difficile]